MKYTVERSDGVEIEVEANDWSLDGTDNLYFYGEDGTVIVCYKNTSWVMVEKHES